MNRYSREDVFKKLYAGTEGQENKGDWVVTFRYRISTFGSRMRVDPDSRSYGGFYVRGPIVNGPDVIIQSVAINKF